MLRVKINIIYPFLLFISPPPPSHRNPENNIFIKFKNMKQMETEQLCRCTLKYTAYTHPYYSFTSQKLIFSFTCKIICSHCFITTSNIKRLLKCCFPFPQQYGFNRRKFFHIKNAFFKGLMSKKGNF